MPELGERGILRRGTARDFGVDFGPPGGDQDQCEGDGIARRTAEIRLGRGAHDCPISRNEEVQIKRKLRRARRMKWQLRLQTRQTPYLAIIETRFAIWFRIDWTWRSSNPKTTESRLYMLLFAYDLSSPLP